MQPIGYRRAIWLWRGEHGWREASSKCSASERPQRRLAYTRSKSCSLHIISPSICPGASFEACEPFSPPSTALHTHESEELHACAYLAGGISKIIYSTVRTPEGQNRTRLASVTERYKPANTDQQLLSLPQIRDDRANLLSLILCSFLLPIVNPGLQQITLPIETHWRRRDCCCVLL